MVTKITDLHNTVKALKLMTNRLTLVVAMGLVCGLMFTMGRANAALDPTSSGYESSAGGAGYTSSVAATAATNKAADAAALAAYPDESTRGLAQDFNNKQEVKGEEAKAEEDKKQKECDAAQARAGSDTAAQAEAAKGCPQAKVDYTTPNPVGSGGTIATAAPAESNVSANAMGADGRQQGSYYQDGFAAKERNTKAMSYVTLKEAKEKNLAWGWGESTQTSDFGARESQQTLNGAHSSSNHMGQDYSVGGNNATMGADVYSSQNGKVVFAGEKGGYGNTVIVQTKDAAGKTVQTQYSHLSDMNVQVGDSVTAGYKVGDAGKTGNSTGAHLHYGEMVDGSYVNPATTTNVKNYESQSPWSSNSNSAAVAGNNPTSNPTGNPATGQIANTGSTGQVASSNPLTSGLGTTIQQLLGGQANGSGGILNQLLSGSGGSEISGLLEKLMGGSKSSDDDDDNGKAAGGGTTGGSGTGTKVSGYDIALAIQQMCQQDLSANSDAQMLKVSMCQTK